MDKEVSHSVTLAVTLMALAVLIGLVMYTVNIGDHIKNDAIVSIVTIQSDMNMGQLNSLAGGDIKIMPKASAYYILTKDGAGVKEIYYRYLKLNAAGTDYELAGGLYKATPKGNWGPNGSDGIPSKSLSENDVYLFPADVINKGNLDGKVTMEVERLSSSDFRVTIEDVDLHK